MKKNALIIGGSGALGSAIINRLQNEGAYCYNISKTKNIECKENIIIDLSKNYEFDELKKLLYKIKKKINIVFISSGIIGPELSTELSNDVLYKMLNIHAIQPLEIIKVLKKNGYLSKDAIILNISSSFIYSQERIYEGYKYSKMLSNQLVEKFAKNNPNLHLISFCPGAFQSKIQNKLKESILRKNNYDNVKYKIKKPNIIANHILVRLDLFKKLNSGSFVNLNELI